MADNESQVKVKLTTEDKTKPGIDSAKGNFGKFKDAIGDVAKSLTGMDLSTIGVVGAITFAAGEAKKAITEYSSYVEQIDKMSMATGMSADEMSRLAQVADDFRVDIGGLQSALGMALKNGFNPTIENLAKLSDEMAGITDPTERAEKLTKIFGRQWETVIPLLNRGGAAIREASASITDGLVVTEESIAANREYQKAVDDLEDAWTDAKNTFARDVIPVLTDVLNWLNANTEAARENKKALDEGYGKVEGLTGGYGDLAAEMRRATLAQIGMTDSEKRARDAARRNAEVLDEELNPAIQETEKSAFAADTEMRIFANGVQQAADSAAIAAGHMDELQAAQLEFNGAIQDFNQNYAGDVVSKLEAAGIKGEDLEEALGAIDKQAGTNYLTQYKLNQEMDKMIENYQKTGDIEEFSDALEENRDKWAKIDEAIGAAYTKFNNFIASIAGADGLEVTITVNAVQAYGGGGGGNSNGYKPGKDGPGVYGYEDYIDPDGGGATGLHMTVPPGYDEINGRPFYVAAQSGETIDINPAGTDTEQLANITIAPGAIVINGTGQNAEAIANKVIAKIGQITRNGKLAGLGYAGG